MTTFVQPFVHYCRNRLPALFICIVLAFCIAYIQTDLERQTIVRINEIVGISSTADLLRFEQEAKALFDFTFYPLVYANAFFILFDIGRLMRFIMPCIMLILLVSSFGEPGGDRKGCDSCETFMVTEFVFFVIAIIMYFISLVVGVSRSSSST